MGKHYLLPLMPLITRAGAQLSHLEGATLHACSTCVHFTVPPPTTFLWQGQFGVEERRGMDGQNQNRKCAKGRGIWERGRQRREEGRKHKGHGDLRYWLRTYSGGRGS